MTCRLTRQAARPWRLVVPGVAPLRGLGVAEETTRITSRAGTSTGVPTGCKRHLTARAMRFELSKILRALRPPLGAEPAHNQMQTDPSDPGCSARTRVC